MLWSLPSFFLSSAVYVRWKKRKKKIRPNVKCKNHRALPSFLPLLGLSPSSSSASRLLPLVLGQQGSGSGRSKEDGLRWRHRQHGERWMAAIKAAARWASLVPDFLTGYEGIFLYTQKKEARINVRAFQCIITFNLFPSSPCDALDLRNNSI